MPRTSPESRPDPWVQLHDWPPAIVWAVGWFGGILGYAATTLVVA